MKILLCFDVNVFEAEKKEKKRTSFFLFLIHSLYLRMLFGFGGIGSAFVDDWMIRLSEYIDCFTK